MADLQCSDAGADLTCYFDADPVKQASIISNEIGMYVINVWKLKIAKIIRIFRCHEFPQAPEIGIPLVTFRIFLKFRGNIRSSRCFTGVGVSSGAHWLANIAANFQTNSNDLNVIFRGLREDDLWKKTWSKKSRDTILLKGLVRLSGLGTDLYFDRRIHN